VRVDHISGALQHTLNQQVRRMPKGSAEPSTLADAEADALQLLRAGIVYFLL
jgi:hypothetical protein